MSVAERFSLLLSRLRPNAREVERVETHRHTVQTRLESRIGVVNILIIGSYSRGTFIHNSSDLDMLAILHRDEVVWGDDFRSSNAVMGRIRDELQGRFQRTGIGRDGQAVVVDFRDGHPVDVVPAVEKRVKAGAPPAFWIPDGNGWWMTTSPAAHNDFISRADRRSGGKLRGVAMLLKHWRACGSRNITLSSFHVELALAQAGVCEGAKSYAQCVADALELLVERRCRALRDPCGISGFIRASNTDAQQDAAFRLAQASFGHALSALEAEYRRRSPEAYRQWKLVFNTEFPSTNS